MKGQMFRIAHIGYFDYLDTIAIIGALEQVSGDFAEAAGLPVRQGAGRAAQESLSSARRSRAEQRGAGSLRKPSFTTETRAKAGLSLR